MLLKQFLEDELKQILRSRSVLLPVREMAIDLKETMEFHMTEISNQAESLFL